MSGVECSSRMHHFLHSTAEGLAIERPIIARELLQNGVEKDDAIELRETLRQIADCYCAQAGGTGLGGQNEPEM